MYCLGTHVCARRWEPSYFRVVPELTLTPLQSDAGADMTLHFPTTMAEALARGGAEAPDDDSSRGRAQGGRPGAALPAGMGRESTGDGSDGGGGGGGGVPASERGWGPLGASDLPERGWPAPDPGHMWSPFSLGRTDFVRAVAPGVYVGCGYREAAPGVMNEEGFVYFAMVRTD
jgi:hypothetical protein